MRYIKDFIENWKYRTLYEKIFMPFWVFTMSLILLSIIFIILALTNNNFAAYIENILQLYVK